jgi:hypothetical protein
MKKLCGIRDSTSSGFQRRTIIRGFFHLRASQQKKKNRISKLTKLNGTTTSNEGEMGSIGNEFYQQLYTWEGVANMEAVL